MLAFAARGSQQVEFTWQRVTITKNEEMIGNLSGPVRDTPPYRAIPFRDSIAEGGIAPICLVVKGIYFYRSICFKVQSLSQSDCYLVPTSNTV